MPLISTLATSKYITNKNYGYRSASDIKFIIPHHMAAHWTGAYAANWFQNNGRENSVNYCIGYGGDISCNVYEENGAWTSSNNVVDRRGITIECSDTSATNYIIPEPTQESLIKLMVDLFMRYPSLGGKAVFDPADETEVVKARKEGRVPNTRGNILLHKWTSGGTTTCPEWHMTKIMPDICKEVNKRLNNISKLDSYIASLNVYGDGRYHYYDGKANGIGCSEYTRLALLRAGIIKAGETFHAASGNVGVLADTSRFQQIAWNKNNLKKGDIMWSQGHHVATWDGTNGVYEAAPESTHGVCDNTKTGVGHFTNHTYYNCGTGTYNWSCLYRIIDKMNRTLHEEAQYMIDNNINGQARKNQAIADGFKPEDVQAEIDRMLAKNPSENVGVMVKYMPTLQYGDKNDFVLILQNLLKYMGYLTVTPDGIFGNYTYNALVAFQKNINTVYGNFSVDGVCGQKTWSRLLLNK